MQVQVNFSGREENNNNNDHADNHEQFGDHIITL